MSDEAPNRALLIAGPTASGKSALALRLARDLNGTIINADALQVYSELRILSARPSHDDERNLPHRLYGHVPGNADYSVARWLVDVGDELRSVWAEDRLPVIVGGTGLYFRALEQGLAEIPPIPDEVREKWRGFTGDLAHELSRRDPVSAASLQPGDRQRLTRALEVIEATGEPLRFWQRQAQGKALLSHVRTDRLFVDVPRQLLYARAESRFDSMVDAGAADEVRHVLGFDPDLPMMRAIGVPELRDYLLGRTSLAAATDAAKQATRHYIKRQLTWWRNQPEDWRSVNPDAGILLADILDPA